MYNFSNKAKQYTNIFVYLNNPLLFNLNILSNKLHLFALKITLYSFFCRSLNKVDMTSDNALNSQR